MVNLEFLFFYFFGKQILLLSYLSLKLFKDFVEYIQLFYFSTDFNIVFSFFTAVKLLSC